MISEKTRKKLMDASRKRRERLGYINSPETRKKLSEIMKIKWSNGEITNKQKNTLFKKGYDKRRVKTQFKYGHNVDEKTRLAVKKNRMKQKFPKKDSRIEIKIQKFLKKLGIEFFTHQYIKEIKHGYQCDILIPSMNLIIECDGDYWHKYPMGRKIDHTRTKELLEKGFKVLRLWECEIKKMEIEKFVEVIKG